MSIVNGSFFMQPQPGYPQYTGEANNESLVFQYVTGENDIALPAYGSSPPFIPWASLDLSLIRLSSREVTPFPGGNIVTLTYQSPETVPADKDEILEYRSEELDVPLESHDSYLKKWNHSLLVKTGLTSTPSWWNTAEADHVPPAGSDGKAEYIWAKPGDQPPDGYILLKPASKPGVESFKAYSPRVSLTKYYKNKTSAQSKAALDGTVQTPPDTFGYSGQWLQAGSSIRKEGRWWILQCSFIGSKLIDSDIYQ